MKNVIIPKGTKRIGNHWFWDSDIESVEIPVSVREIGADAFYNCKSLTRVAFALGSELEKIGPGSFCKTGIERVVIPKGVEEIRGYTFQECEHLKEVLFEEKSVLKTIGEDAFRWCTNLTKITFPEGLEKIELDAFAGSGLENVELPASLRMVSQCTFRACKSLKVVRFNEGLEVLGTDEYADGRGSLLGVFEDSSIESVKLPTTLKRIECNVFKNCKNLKNIKLPDSLEYIGTQCFFGSGLTKV